nr:PREDICTED: protein Dok-7 [Bos mutus]
MGSGFAGAQGPDCSCCRLCAEAAKPLEPHEAPGAPRSSLVPRKAPWIPAKPPGALRSPLAGLVSSPQPQPLGGPWGCCPAALRKAQPKPAWALFDDSSQAPVSWDEASAWLSRPTWLDPTYISDGSSPPTLAPGPVAAWLRLAAVSGALGPTEPGMEMKGGKAGGAPSLGARVGLSSCCGPPRPPRGVSRAGGPLPLEARALTRVQSSSETRFVSGPRPENCRCPGCELISDRARIQEDWSERAKGLRERSSLTLEDICGLEPGLPYEGLAHTLAIVCLSQAVMLGFDSREAMCAWDARIRYALGEVHRFPVIVAPGTKLESGPATLHLCNDILVVARDVPPAVAGQWKLSDLRRYGAVPNGFIFEGGTRCGFWAGVFFLSSTEGDQISFLFDCIVRGISPTKGPFGLRPVLPDPSPGGPALEERVAQEALEALQLEKRLSLLSHSGRPGSGEAAAGAGESWEAGAPHAGPPPALFSACPICGGLKLEVGGQDHKVQGGAVHSRSGAPGTACALRGGLLTCMDFGCVACCVPWRRGWFRTPPWKRARRPCCQRARGWERPEPWVGGVQARSHRAAPPAEPAEALAAQGTARKPGRLEAGPPFCWPPAPRGRPGWPFMAVAPDYGGPLGRLRRRPGPHGGRISVSPEPSVAQGTAGRLLHPFQLTAPREAPLPVCALSRAGVLGPALRGPISSWAAAATPPGLLVTHTGARGPGRPRGETPTYVNVPTSPCPAERLHYLGLQLPEAGAGVRGAGASRYALIDVAATEAAHRAGAHTALRLEGVALGPFGDCRPPGTH